MINVEVVSEFNLWKKKIKNPKTYFKKKLKKIESFLPFKKNLKNFTILLTNNIKMKYLNNKFRDKKVATDVLSFPFYNIKEISPNKEKNIYLGDLAISYQFVKKKSKHSNFEVEFDKLWIHGYLHLLGYDHKKNKDYNKMSKVENKILKIFHS